MKRRKNENERIVSIPKIRVGVILSKLRIERYFANNF